MKIQIGRYPSYFGPYQLAEKLLFWLDKYKDDRVHNFGMWLAGDTNDPDGSGRYTHNNTLIYKFLLWIDGLKKRRVKIRIDAYDTWNMDSTLALIILPMLKQFKETKHGSQIVDIEDVPEHLRCTTTEDYDSQLTFDFYKEYEVKEGECDIHARWDWVLDEMIWAFEQCQPDCYWEAQYYTGQADWQFKKNEGLSEMIPGPNHTIKVDCDGLRKHHERVQNGFRLFGKYYQGLWT